MIQINDLTGDYGAADDDQGYNEGFHNDLVCDPADKSPQVEKGDRKELNQAMSRSRCRRARATSRACKPMGSTQTNIKRMLCFLMIAEIWKNGLC